MSRPERIGVLGGTFDPIHVGHLVAAVNARHTLRLNRVVLVVANIPWQKSGTRAVSPAEDRFEMTRAATEGLEGIEASRIEIDRGAESYTADTLAALAQAHRGAELFLVVGADLVGELETWERVDQVREHATLVVVNRPGTTAVAGLEGWRTETVDIPALDISSTDLRTRVRDGRPLDFLIPPAAVRCIRERGLYAGHG